MERSIIENLLVKI